jgi:hypothetical protein
MVARRLDTGVYRYFALVDGRSAFYTIDWNGVESDLRVVQEGESEDRVIQEMAKQLGAMHPPSRASGRSRRPPLFLV